VDRGHADWFFGCKVEKLSGLFALQMERRQTSFSS
jgi:hypothetical protein